MLYTNEGDIMLIESEVIELKERYTDSLLRDIVAFLNAKGGTIYVGIDDNGVVKGLSADQLDDTQKKISDCITSQIEPNPQNEISILQAKEENKEILAITVSKGFKPIYCIKKYGYSSKGCLIRIGTTCKEMNPIEIERRYRQNFVDDDFILQAPAHYAPLSFDMMKILLTSRGYHINETAFESNFSLLMKNGEYNLMAELLSDKNMVPLIFVKFRGNTKASISQRSDYGDQSILLGLQRLKDRLIAENICVTDTTVRPRVDEYLYDIDCVNEALVNAIVHNDWTISEPLVSLYNDRIEITSHGGIPREISREDFFNGVSHPRNSVLMRIFLKLGIVEHTGHGIPKIIEKYGKQAFDIHDTYVNVIIPFNKRVTETLPNFKDADKDYDKNISSELTDNEKRVLLELINNPSTPYDSLVVELGISRRTVSRVFTSLAEKGFIERIGTNKKGFWKVIR